MFRRSRALARSTPSLALALALGGCGGEPPRAPAPVGSATTPSAPPPPVPTEVAPTPTAKPAPTLTELEQRTLRAVFEALNAHEARRLAALYTEAAVVDVMGTPAQAKGRDAVAATWQRLFDTFSSFRAAPTRLLVKGDVVVVEWVWSGVHSGDLFGVKATEKPVGTAAADVFWFTPDGAIKEQHAYFDMATVLAQIGRSKQKARAVPTITSSAPEVVAAGGAEEAKNAELAAQMYGAFAKKSEADFLGGLAEDLVWDELAMPEAAVGKDAARKWFGMTTAAWTDAKRTTTSTWAVSDWVVTEGAFTGKHTGKLGDLAPTKKDVTLHQLDILFVKSGKISRGTSYGYGAELAAQLGLAPMPGAKAAATKEPAKAAATKEPPKPVSAPKTNSGTK